MSHDNKNLVFTPENYNDLLCQYLQALGDEFLLEKNYKSNLRGQFILNIRGRVKNRLKLTKQQSYTLGLIEKELSQQIIANQTAKLMKVETNEETK